MFPSQIGYPGAMKTHLHEPEISRSNFVGLLRQELQFRQEKNPRYSIRSFAKSLSIDQSFLTKILNGSRLPSTNLIQKTNRRLKSDMLQAEKKAPQTADLYTRIEDTFHLIADWYHFALIELIRTDNFVPDEKWICRRLGINQTQLQLAVSRLVRVGLLEIQNKKWILKTDSLSWTNNLRTSEARRMLQKQISLMSHMAIDEVDFNLRDHSSLTIALDPDLIPELKQRLTQFRQSLDQLIQEKSTQPREVYQFTFSMFPVSQQAPTKSTTI